MLVLRRRIAPVVLIGLSLASVPARGLVWDFDRLDQDSNGRINMQELTASDLASDWDADGNGVLAYDEFERPDLFPSWDRDNDGVVDRKEFYETTMTFYDMNGSESLERHEFPAASPFPRGRGPLAGDREDAG